MEMQPMSPVDYLQILKRRQWSLILPTLFILLISTVVALVLPSVYRSTATILIEGQDIPVDFVVTSVTSYAEQRLQSINQRIMSSSVLAGLINQFDLYRNFRSRHTTEEVIEKIRKSVVLEPISAEVTDQRTGRSQIATIAFTLSYEGDEPPEKVQQVASTITSLFLKENIQARERQVKETSEFLENEMNRVKDHLKEIEGSISQFKKKHMNELPELLQVNMQSLNNIDQRINSLIDLLNSLKEREGYLEVQLTDMIPESEMIAVNTAEQRLEALKLELLSLQAKYSNIHPDVGRMKSEIASLEKELNTPDKDIDGIEEDTVIEASKYDNPGNQVYNTVKAQLSSIKVQIENTETQIGTLHQSKSNYQHRIEASPKVDEMYREITIDRNNTQGKYDDLMRKLMESRVSQGLEKEQKGERFTLIDPAQLPEKPYKPNRLAIMLIGVVLALGSGVGFAAVREYSDQSIRSADELTMATSYPVLATLPEIWTEKDFTRLRLSKIILISGSSLAIIVGIITFHYLIMDLDVFWAKVVRNLWF